MVGRTSLCSAAESMILANTCLGMVVMLAKLILHGESRAWLLEGLPLKLMNLYYYLPTNFGRSNMIVIGQQK
ncbi:hypothetical protein Scep_024115 [Stephania cephalantha]|uniref:Uncharacterized protein n=1 Tax=Stephania cephalantha TaxID=152367 RepID=A0AAP0EYQ4_9MAGN